MANDAESIRGEWIATVSSDMSDQANDAVSIQLSRKKDGKTLEARHKATRWWATVFFMICGFAVFIDPLFCYIYVIDRDNMRISSDPKAMWAYFGLRTTIDVFYFIDIIVFLCGGEGKKFGACCWKQENDQKSTVIEKCYLLRRILVALPIPEVLVVCAPFINNSDPFYAIFVIVPFQYTLRIFLIYGGERWSLINETTQAMLKPLLVLLPFILASHLFGALWYRLAVQRQIDCWKPHCEVIRGNNCTRIKDFQIPKAINITHLQALCPTNSEDKKVFDFGIYLYALQPNSTCSSNLLQRISQSFWWALRNLSSFGENLQTSMHTLEIYFSIVISISGIALFVVCISATIKG
ncbi:cyclic nucleotide-gated ion channel 1-like isoform X1 [Rosa rugosa]|uniref:cyclic nucleotide-gated ion channel 1-like isoform X1 n=1 Tax=Rosa rugosa TaxID=74645 RepID=UPI002B409560|nr:cyclic nucleotide-gated ion channel 1-like isoform X1 [Rosa rugosa]